MENILQVKDLKKVFHQHGKRDVTAVENMSFSLRAGEILGIVGESGSGKSTVAKLITRLEAVRGTDYSGWAGHHTSKRQGT